MRITQYDAKNQIHKFEMRSFIPVKRHMRFEASTRSNSPRSFLKSHASPTSNLILSTFFNKFQ